MRTATLTDRLNSGRGFNETAVRRVPCASLLIGFASLLIFLSPAMTRFLEFDRMAIAGGQLWRILTCHLTHWSFEHLFWDVVVFIVLGVSCERASRKSFLVCLAVSASAIGISVWLFLPEMRLYRGLSGIDSALFVCFTVRELRERYEAKNFLWVFTLALGLIAFSTKLVYEMATGSALFVSNTDCMVPVPLAHFVGGLIGLVINRGTLPEKRQDAASTVSSPRHFFHNAP